MALFRRSRGYDYGGEEEDRVEFRTDLRLKLRFLWIDLKHGLASRRPLRPLLVRLRERREAREEARRTAPLPRRPFFLEEEKKRRSWRKK